MEQTTFDLLTRIAGALERLAPPPPALPPVPIVSRVEIGLLKGVDRQKSILVENTLRFARGLPANNAMLWGARGNGKSSLVKATHAVANVATPGSLVVI